MKYLVAFALISSSAFAADAPTVTLTQDQLQRLIQAETAKAVSGYIAQEKTNEAKDVYSLIQSAFGPTQPKSQPKGPR